MRPNTAQYPVKLYECFYCGARTSDSTVEGCPECGGELVNLSTSRDL